MDNSLDHLNLTGWKEGLNYMRSGTELWKVQRGGIQEQCQAVLMCTKIPSGCIKVHTESAEIQKGLLGATSQ